jgi:hypothetical protein
MIFRQVNATKSDSLASFLASLTRAQDYTSTNMPFVTRLTPLDATAGRFKLKAIIVILSVLYSVIALGSSNRGVYLHDLSSYIAPVADWLDSEGLPYKDYFDIKPPGVYFFLYFIAHFINLNYLTLVILYLLFLLLFFATFNAILVYSFGLRTAAITQLPLFLITIFSDSFTNMFFPLEIVCSTLILIAVLLRISAKEFGLKLITCYSLILLSSLFRENYFFVFIGFLLFDIMVLGRIKIIFKSFLFAFMITYGFAFMILHKAGLWNYYFEISQFKSRAFGIDISSLIHFFVLNKYSIIINLVMIFSIYIGILYHWKNKLNLVFYKENPKLFLFWLLMVCMYTGSIIQAKSFSGHYLLSFWPFFLIYWHGLLSFVSKSASRHATYYKVVIALLISIVPLNQLFKDDLPTVLYGAFSSAKGAFLYENLELKKDFELPISDCLMVAYGWATGSYYLYSDVSPCNRYFLPSLIASDPQTISKFREAMFLDPPLQILFEPGAHDGNLEEFNSKVFDYPKVITNCYAATEIKNLFRISGLTHQTNSKCLIKFS